MKPLSQTRSASELVKVECFKVLHSKVFLLTLAASLFMPIMAGTMMFIIQNPEMAKNIGLVGQSGSLSGTADWEYYLALLARMFSFGMFSIGFGFIISWVFGREYNEHTLKDMLALPVPRGAIVLAKFVAVVVSSAIFFAVAFAAAMLLGYALHLGGWSSDLALRATGYYGVAAISAIWLNTPLAFLAGYTKGYLAPIGLIAVTAVLGNFFATVGYAQYYPWLIPMTYITQELSGLHLGLASWTIVLGLGLAGLAGTIAWWRYADQQ
jgi:ABC-2 type transport system permease protein